MAPDDLHTVFGGILGAHMPNILAEIGHLLPQGHDAFLEAMDGRLHRCYTLYRPSGLRLPSKKDFFTKPTRVPNYEWKAIMQVLPIMVAGFFRVGGKDVLAEWAVALAEWVFATFWTPDGKHTEETLAESDRLLLRLDKRSRKIGKLQNSDWNFRKYHELCKFTASIRWFGVAKWLSTERGEHKHQWVKIWWDEMNGKNVEAGLHTQ